MPRFVIALLVILTASAAVAAPLPPVTTRGDEFVIGDTAFRFVGVNLRGIAHYGEGDILPYTTAAHRTENLDGVVAMGGRVIRIFAPIGNPARDPGVSATDELIARLTVLLDQCEARGLRVIVALTDFYAASGFRVPGDDAFYTDNGSGFVVLNDAWFAGGFRTNYLPWVRAAVTALRDHSAVFAWEIGNELTDFGGASDNIVPFVAEVAAEIRALDPDTMIAFGGLGMNHFAYGPANAQFIAIYTDPNIDFVTIHTYNGAADNATYEVAWAVEKPILVEETGNTTSYTSDRPATLTAQMADWLDTRGGRGILQWGYQWQTYDIGDGDALYGMDRHFFAFDWDGMNAAYLARAQLFADNPVTVLPAELPTGDNLARSAAAWATSSDFSAAHGGDKAIDGIVSPASKWTSQGTAGPHWLALDLGDTFRLTGAIVRSAGAANEWHGYDLTALQVQTGPSLSGPWTTQASFADARARNRAVCLFAAPVDARFVRLLVTDAGFDNYARVPEFEVYGGPATTAVRQGVVYR